MFLSWRNKEKRKLYYLELWSLACLFYFEFYFFYILALKATSEFIAEYILKSVYYFSEKIRFDILCELSAMQTIHMKCQALLSLKIKKNVYISKCFLV